MLKLKDYGEDMMCDAVHATEEGARAITEEIYERLGLAVNEACAL